MVSITNLLYKHWQALLIVVAFGLMVGANLHQHYLVGDPWAVNEGYWMMIGFYVAFLIGFVWAVNPKPMHFARITWVGLSLIILGLAAYEYDHLVGGWFPGNEHLFDGLVLLRITTNALMFIGSITMVNIVAFTRLWALELPDRDTTEAVTVAQSAS